MAKPLKATFCVVNADGCLRKPIPVRFNPTEYSLNKGAQIAELDIPGLDSPILQFVRGQTETLALDLFFDSTESGMDDDATSVTTLTDPFYQLVKIDGKTHAPPVCFFTWGSEFPGQSGLLIHGWEWKSAAPRLQVPHRKRAPAIYLVQSTRSSTARDTLGLSEGIQNSCRANRRRSIRGPRIIPKRR